MNTNEFEASVGKTIHKLKLLDDRQIEVDGQKHSFDWESEAQDSFSLILDNCVFDVSFIKTTGDNHDNSIQLSINGIPYKVIVEDHRSLIRKSLQPNQASFSRAQDVRAPMPGKVVRIEVRTGDMVAPGRGLLVLEAMKMENEIKSTMEGRVGKILVVAGRPVEKGEILLSIKPS